MYRRIDKPSLSQALLELRIPIRTSPNTNNKEGSKNRTSGSRLGILENYMMR